jgi:Cu/Zn superoxide dismutase
MSESSISIPGSRKETTRSSPAFIPKYAAGARDTVPAGDLPDITVGNAEWADTTFDWAHLRLNKDGYGLFREGGTSLVITEQPDHGQPGTGGRILACGIVKERPEER